MSLNRLAATTFSSGPDETLAVVDVYAATNSEVVSSIENTAPVIDTTDPVTATGSSLTDSSFKGVNENPEISVISQQSITDRLGSLGKDSALRNSIKDYSNKATAVIGVGDQLRGTISGVLGNQTSTILSKNFQAAGALSGIINNFSTGKYDINFKDIGAISGLVASVTQQASRLGLPAGFSTMAAGVTNKIALLGAVQKILPDMSSKGDVDTLTDMSTTVVVNDISCIRPNIVKDTLGNYTTPKEAPQIDYKAYYDKVTAGLGGIDQAWSTVSRGGTPVLSAAVAANSSFNQLIKSKAFSAAKETVVGSPATPSAPAVPPSRPIYNSDEHFQLLVDTNTQVDSTSPTNITNVPLKTAVLTTTPYLNTAVASITGQPSNTSDKLLFDDVSAYVNDPFFGKIRKSSSEDIARFQADKERRLALASKTSDSIQNEYELDQNRAYTYLDDYINRQEIIRAQTAKATATA
jgi:hypothetical protein